MVYDESYFYFKEKDAYSEYKSDESELNTIIDMIFKINEDISGVSIYRPKGGMISYTNPYGPYYYISGTKSRYSEAFGIQGQRQRAREKPGGQPGAVHAFN